MDSSTVVLDSLAELDSPSLKSPAALAVSAAPRSQALVYVGTRAGHLLLLSLNRSPPSLALRRSVHLASSPVQALHVLPELGRVLAVSSGLLYLVDLHLSRPHQRLASFRDVSAVSRRLRLSDSASPDPLSVVAARSVVSRPGQGLLQKLGTGIMANGSKVRVPEDRDGGSRSSCFLAAVVAGKGLVLIELVLLEDPDSGISVSTREVQVQGVDGVRAIAWIDDSVAVGTSEGYLMFSIESGQFVPIFTLPELSGTPHMIPLHRSKELLLFVDNVGIVVDGDGQPVGGSLIFGSRPDSVTDIASYVVASTDGKLELYRRKGGSCVQSITMLKGSLVDPCVVAADGDIVIAAMSHKIICFRRLSSEEQIKDLLKKRCYPGAISLVGELASEGEITKEMLSFVHAQVGFMLLFELQFEDAVSHFLLSESMKPSEIFPFIMNEPNRWSHLVPRNRYWGLHPPPVLLEKVVDDGLLAVQRAIFLKKAGVDAFVSDNFVRNPPSRSDLLESAVKNIIRYLVVSRDRDLDLSVKEGVDTLLMYLYRSLNLVNDMERLASSQNSCVVEELETLLDDSGHLRTLAFLYASKGMSSKALSIWHLLARNYSSGLWKDPSSAPQCQMLNTAVSSQRTAAIEASKLLEESSDQELILQHLGWIADEDQEIAIRVLTSDKRAKQLPPGDVLAAIDQRKVEIRQRYLQWLIEDQDSDDSQLHTMYALSLAMSILEVLEGHQKEGSYGGNRTNNVNALEYVEPLVPPRDRLQFFLQSSDLYDPKEVLRLIAKSDLWLEKAILYRKLGEEKQVLEILALELEDCKAAEQYCAEIGREDTYMQLLDMYLNPHNGKRPHFKAAANLIHAHGGFLDPLQVLQKLSPEMPLQLASSTILKLLRARLHHHLEGQIVQHLSYALNVEAKLARLEERSRHVQINDESICSSCHTRLGTKLLAMYPDDTVVCYKCYRRQGESKSAIGRDFKHDIIFKSGWLVTRNF